MEQKSHIWLKKKEEGKKSISFVWHITSGKQALTVDKGYRSEADS